MTFGFCKPIKFNNVTQATCFGYNQTFIQVVGVVAIARS
jgi:hypothetical protein